MKDNFIVRCRGWYELGSRVVYEDVLLRSEVGFTPEEIKLTEVVSLDVQNSILELYGTNGQILSTYKVNVTLGAKQ